ncbi:MAG: hypothetical protein Q9201_004699, partial [Fulgogasparrea decipioides]
NYHLITNPDEPATVKIGNEVHQLHPLNRITDEPSTRKSLAQILELCQERRDWVNMIPFLQGLRESGRAVKGWQVEKIVRRMGEKGSQGVVIEMLRQVERTGVRLGNLGVCREVLWAVGLGKCVQSGWTEEGVREAERYVEGVWDMLSEERHVDAQTKKVHGDPKMRPEIVGMVLWVRALKRVSFGEGEDEDGKVKRATEMVLAVWEKPKLQNSEAESNWPEENQKLVMWTPVWHGMKLARRIIGESMPLGRDLGRVMTSDLEPLLKNARDVVAAHSDNETRRRGLIIYDELSKVAS